MSEGLLYETRLKLAGTDGITGHLSWRRYTIGTRYSPRRRIAIRRAINAGIIVG
jgi:hypothetical protein